MSITKQKKVVSRKGKKSVTYSRVIFTRYSGNPNYRTPSEVYEALNKEFHFTDDPCPINSTSKNGLTRKWGKRAFINPPYSDPNSWVEKGLAEIQNGHTVLAVFLLKGDISTALFHDLVIPYSKEIRAVRGRLKFGKYAKTNESSPFPSAVVIFRAGPKIAKFKTKEQLKELGQKKKAVQKKAKPRKKKPLSETEALPTLPVVDGDLLGSFDQPKDIEGEVKIRN